MNEKLLTQRRYKDGLKVRCILDRKHYPPKVQVTDEQMSSIKIMRDEFHGEWNYTICPS